MFALVAALAWFWWAVFVVLWVMFIYFTFALAVSKGRSPVLWVILALFLPLITIILLLVMPDRSTR
jgi:Na+-translocating ferredoxin:NAD+ oxidoreductase RnfA subunit